MASNKAARILLMAGGMVLAWPTGGAAQTAPPASPEALRQLRAALDEERRKAVEQERLIAEQTRLLTEQQHRLDGQRQRLDALSRQLGQPIAPPGSAPTPVPAPATSEPAPRPSTPAPASGQEPQTVAQRPPTQAPAAAEAIGDQARGILTPKGMLVVEPGVEYSYADQNRILIEGLTIIPALTIGAIDVRRVQRETLNGSVALRYGATSRIEVETKIPYIYRNESTTARELIRPEPQDSTSEASGHGLGDVELAGRYQLTAGSGGWPFLVAGLRFKSRTGTTPYEVDVAQQTRLERDLPTGTGFYSLQPSLTALFPSDPGVFFGSINYTWNVARDLTLQGGARTDIDPGDSIGFSVGMGFGLNDRASFSLGYDHTFVRKTSQDGQSQPGSDVQIGSFTLGYAYRLSNRVSLSLQSGIGVTEAAPDIRLIARVPIRFTLF